MCNHCNCVTINHPSYRESEIKSETDRQIGRDRGTESERERERETDRERQRDRGDRVR